MSVDEEQEEQGHEMSALGATLKAHLARMEVGPESFLPVAAVEMQRTLAVLDDDELMHVIVGGAIQIAARDLGTLSPVDVLEKAVDKSRSSFRREHWLDKLAPEVRRISTAARERGELEPDLGTWVAGELLHLADELRVARPVDAPTLSDALRTLADSLADER
jgi:hypothetical protein